MIGLISAIVLMTLIAAVILLYPLWRGHRRLVFLLLLLFSGLAFGLYFHWGASDAVFRYWALKDQTARVQAALEDIKTPDEVIDQLRVHLKADPQSAKGWYLLGRLYLDTGQYALSESALDKAHRLKPHKAAYFVAYAQAWFFNHDEPLSEHLVQTLKALLARSPNDSAAINLLALSAYREGDYRQAIDYWERLIPQFPAGSQDRKALLRMIAQAQEKLRGHENVENH